MTTQEIKDIESNIDSDFLVKSLNNIDFNEIKNKILLKFQIKVDQYNKVNPYLIMENLKKKYQQL